MGIKIECVRDDAGFLALEEDWNNLLSQSKVNSIFLTWEWCSVWWEHFKDSRQLYVLTAREEDSNAIVGIAPLIIQPKSFYPQFGKNQIKISTPIKSLSFIGSNRAAPDHLDFITLADDDSAAVQAFTDYLHNVKPDWNIIDFRGISSSSLIPSILLSGISTSKVYQAQAEIPIIDLPDTWDELYANYNKKQRQNIRRRERRINEDFPDRITHKRIDDPEEIQPLIEKILDFGRETRGELSESSGPEFSRISTFFVEIAKTFLSQNWLRLFTLSIDDEIIAVQNMFLYREKVYSFQKGYSPEYATYSPGNIILVRNIQELINEKAKMVDFLRGEHEYKLRWASRLDTNSHIILAIDALGSAFLKIFQAGRKLRAALPNRKEED